MTYFSDLSALEGFKHAFLHNKRQYWHPELLVYGIGDVAWSPLLYFKLFDWLNTQQILVLTHTPEQKALLYIINFQAHYSSLSGERTKGVCWFVWPVIKYDLPLLFLKYVPKIISSTFNCHLTIVINYLTDESNCTEE